VLSQSTTYPQVAANNNSTTITTFNSNTTLAGNSDSGAEPVQAYAKLEGDSFSYYIRYERGFCYCQVVQVRLVYLILLDNISH